MIPLFDLSKQDGNDAANIEEDKQVIFMKSFAGEQTDLELNSIPYCNQ